MMAISSLPKCGHIPSYIAIKTAWKNGTAIWIHTISVCSGLNVVIHASLIGIRPEAVVVLIAAQPSIKISGFLVRVVIAPGPISKDFNYDS